MKGWCNMDKNNKTNQLRNIYDDDNIPEVDLPMDKSSNKTDYENVELLPESFRPRKDGPGGDCGE